MLNFPLAAPSANISSKLSPTSAKDVVEEFGSKIKLVLDGGQCEVGLESTIIDLSSKPKILRQGVIVKDEIQKILKKKVSTNKNSNNIKVPGQLKLHYYPGIPVFINRVYPKKNAAFITFGKSFKNDKNYFNLSKKSNLKEAANNLYRIMRKIKNKKFETISVCKIPNRGVGLAINDRLKKASYKWKK
jgi:L-threonylcarbamoyladenylate synthase